uniref:MARVEL domain-containing protein n=1 Tax=Oreochromis aureus TaxID=47969 RepID=A0A668SAW9_OREAU
SRAVPHLQDYMNIFFPETCQTCLFYVFAIVVFGTISDQGYYSPMSKANGTCMFNNNECACSYAVGVGVLAFVACVVFPILDIIISKISDATAKTAMTFLWFICFCVLLNQWSRTNSEYVMADAARAAIAFSFFSIITWVSLTHNTQLVWNLLCKQLIYNAVTAANINFETDFQQPNRLELCSSGSYASFVSAVYM